MRLRIALALIRWGYRLHPARNVAGVIANPRGKWQPIKL